RSDAMYTAVAQRVCGGSASSARGGGVRNMGFVANVGPFARSSIAATPAAAFALPLPASPASGEAVKNKVSLIDCGSTSQILPVPGGQKSSFTRYVRLPV